MTTFQTRDDTRISFSDCRDPDAEPIVLVHAWALNGDMWNYQVPAFVDAGFRVITFDRRGHGRSDRSGHGYDFDTLAGDLAALVDHLGLSGATLVGHSMEAAEVVRYLTRFGAGAVDRVVLSAPTTPMLLRAEDNPDGIDPATVAALRQLMLRDVGLWLDATSAGYWGAASVESEVSSGMADWTRRAIVDTPLPTLLATNTAFTTTDFRAELPSVTVPTLVIHGDVDLSAPLELTGRRTAALIPGSQLVVIEGGGHGLYFSKAERYNAEVLGFIASTRTQASATPPRGGPQAQL